MEVDPVAGPLRVLEPRREVMLEPDEVAAMMRLHRLGWGTTAVGAAVRVQPHDGEALRRGGRLAAVRGAAAGGKLDGLEAWLRERFHRHRGNADVVRQDLEREHGITVSLRTVERAVQPYRRELAAEARATLRFETPPGRQLQIDFGETRVPIGDATILPARPYKPRDKAKIEAAVLLVQRWIVARLRNRQFLSLEELNAAIREEVARLNARVSRHLGASRQQLFEMVERPAMLPLPPEPFSGAVSRPDADQCWRRARDSSGSGWTAPGASSPPAPPSHAHRAAIG